VRRVAAAIEEGYEPSDALKDAARDFKSIPVDKSRLKPLVGVVGEIYVRHNEAANNFIIRRIEELGLEVELAGFCEWVLYVNHMRLRSCLGEGSFTDFFYTKTKDVVQRIDEGRLRRHFKKTVRSVFEPPTRMLLDAASPYISYQFEGGETVLSVAKTVNLHGERASGAVNVMPFTCMPGTVSAAIMRRVHEELDLFPILNVTYDGQDDATYQTRLEAFAHQVKQYHRNKVAPSPAVPAPNGALTR
jgi:predicted nucleotide-binding protein (sugar kinase/HSP70/actin superfamily)